LFLIDIININSLILIESLLKTINEEKDNFPYLAKIMIKNKINLEKSKPIENLEIDMYLKNIKMLIDHEINYDHNNKNKLLNIIFDAIYYNNENNLLLPTHIISESLERKSNKKKITSLNYVLARDSAMGKTSFLDRYFKYFFEDDYWRTFEIDKEIKYIKVYDNIYKITLWDQPGQRRFRNWAKRYYQIADGVLLLFDLTNKETFDSISSLIRDIKDDSNENFPIFYLIRNKFDLPNYEVSKEEAEKLAESFGIKYFEISCKYNININEVMSRMIIESILKKGINGDLKYFLRKIISPSNEEIFNNFYNNILSKYKNY